ncbi:hypothetical protein CEXT_519301 [Caerostris extrusa]|uniref:Uncharacterized protein n=1 Tax=Caerostris extrusa TaxID=172846 RepID=A0AAV4TCK5_CAEEX|nr:hypothetical protein CEXT_519301 [Caerostris extrusa]
MVAQAEKRVADFRHSSPALLACYLPSSIQVEHGNGFTPPGLLFESVFERVSLPLSTLCQRPPGFWVTGWVDA